MDRKLNKLIADYVGEFKKDIKEKALGMQFNDEKIQELIEYVTPHGVINMNNNDESLTTYVIGEVVAEDINGIVYYLDKNGNIFSTEDVLKGTPNPKVVARYTLSNGAYTIH